MATRKPTKNAANPHPKRAIDDNFVAPKRKKAPKATTLAEALAESGETIEELTKPQSNPLRVREPGSSNLANTIRAHRKGYAPAVHPNGKKTQNCADRIANLLLPIPLDTLKAFSAARFEGNTYNHLNPGHARMCIGNRIRAAAKKGEQDVLEWLAAQQPKVAN